jgi:dienelactone hydrolase
MEKLSFKEKIFYRFVMNERRVYRHWYSRFLICGVDLDRIQRVISRIKNFYAWCDEWSKEGDALEEKAANALSNGNSYTARQLFHEAAGCFHIGQHIYFIDIKLKNKTQERARENYRKAIELYDEGKRPIRVEIPFRGTKILGYLRLTDQQNRPLIIQINGLDNIKEVENHYQGNRFLEAGFNSFTFDGPGQREMWKSMKMISDYENVVIAIIDWFQENNRYFIDLQRIGTYGMSFGGYLSPRVAAFEKRIACAVGNGGFGYLRNSTSAKKVNPIWIKDILHVTGYEDIKKIEFDIKEAPPLDRPFLFIQGGKDKLIPEPKKQADYIMDWAIGEKELKYYIEGEHCCANFLDEVIPYAIDWIGKHL